MVISGFERLMCGYGVAEPLIDEWRAAAAKLPAIADLPLIEDLDKTQTVLLMSKLLRRVAAAIGLDFNHPDIIAEAGFSLVGPFPQERATSQPERRASPRRPERRTGEVWVAPAQAPPQSPAERRQVVTVANKPAQRRQERRRIEDGYRSPQQDQGAARHGTAFAGKNH